MICIIKIEDGEPAEWFIGQNVDEVCQQIQHRRWEDGANRLDQLWQELCSREFRTSGRYDTASGHVLLIE